MRMFIVDSHQRLESLIRSAQQGHPVARGLLIGRYYGLILAMIRFQERSGFSNQESHADLAQTVCVHVLEHLDEYDYRGEGSFRSWLFAWVQNIVRNRRRYFLAQKRNIRREERSSNRSIDQQCEVPMYDPDALTPSTAASVHEEIERIQAAMQELPKDYREVITRARLCELPHDEVSRQMHRSPEATRTLLHRAMARLAEILTKNRRSTM